MLEVGQTFPTFALQDDKGNTVTKQDLMGKPFVIYVYPRDNTPGCTVEACSFRDYYKEIQDLGYNVYGISGDSLASHNKFIDKHNLPFSLLSDPEKTLLTQMGSYGEKMNYGKKTIGIIRSTFIVDAKGNVSAVWKRVKTKDHGKLVFEYIKENLV